MKIVYSILLNRVRKVNNSIETKDMIYNPKNSYNKKKKKRDKRINVNYKSKEFVLF